MPETENPDVQKQLSALTQKLDEQTKKIHALEFEKRITKIHAKNPKFDAKDRSLEWMDGYIQALEDMPNSSPKTHSVAEVVPAGAIKQHKIGEPIDEDAVIVGGSEL
jgi:hypothetical protein